MPANITAGQYLPGRSVVHGLDPRAKIMVLALAGAAVLMAAEVRGYVLVSGALLLYLGLSGLKPSIYWRSLKVIWLILGLSFLLQLCFTPGEPLLELGRMTISRQGLALGGVLFWRLSLLLLFTSSLTFTTTPLQITKALEWLLAPLQKMRLPVRELAMIVNLALRFVPTLFDEARILLLAQRARGADFTRGKIWERARNLTPFFIPLLLNILRRADLMALALEVRCYRVGAARSSMHPLAFRPVDYLAVALALTVLLAVSAAAYLR